MTGITVGRLPEAAVSARSESAPYLFRERAMITEDQSAVIDFLGSPSTHGGQSVERIETHSAIVFLIGARALKLKRAVRFDYLDFSTSERRRVSCEAEVRLNRRTAPSLYRGVLAITRGTDGRLAIGDAGVPVDWVVDMTRFEEADVLDRRAAAGQLDLELMRPLAEAIARFHQAAEPRHDHGGRSGMAWVIDGNAAGFDEFGAGCLDAAAARQVISDARAALEHAAALLDRRRSAGFVRQCHGDLHLRNIVLLDGVPTLFDAVEFNDEISCVDVLYDAAFLLMDLWRRALPRHANRLFNRYLFETGELEGVSLLGLFLSCRAAVRAKTSATAAALHEDATRREALRTLAREYLDLAGRLLHPRPPTLVAVGGLSGSGKSTLALALAPLVGAAPGAVVLRSDEIRKQLCGVPLFEPLGPEGYRPEISARVYETMSARARAVLRGGHSVVLDGVYARCENRREIEHLAATTSVPFAGFWLEAPESVLVARAAGRSNDPSDADASVIRLQSRQDTGIIDWQRLDGAQSPEAVLRDAMARLSGCLSELSTVPATPASS